ncbi:MAG: response regulator [Gemmatimonadaceae bacterium]|nr:response regulator [Chitinophagaceae bacterium]
MKPIKTLTLSLLLLTAAICQGQIRNLKFAHLTTANGLSQSNVKCILQDSRGFMWFGTRDGLNKYDGYKFSVYRNSPIDKYTLTNDFIADIAEDKKGNIWVGTWGGGLNKYDRTKDKFTHYRHDPDNTKSLSSDLIISIFIDSEEKLWVGTADRGLNYYDEKSNSFVRFSGEPGQTGNISDFSVSDVFEDSYKNLWVGTEKGLNLLDRKTGKFTNYRHSPLPGSISNDQIHVIFEDKNRRLWIGTVGGGLNLFDQQSNKFSHFIHNPNNPNSLSNDNVYSLGEDIDGNLWVGTENGGLNILDHRTGEYTIYKHDDFDTHSLLNNSLHSIYRDRKGNMWVGTFTGGINYVNLDGNKFTHYKHTSAKNSLSDNNVLSIFEDHAGMIWIGTDGGGLNRFNPVTSEFTHYKHDELNSNSICGNFVLNVSEDRHGNIWAGTWGDGVSVLDPKTNRFRHFKANPADSNALASNNAWVVYKDKKDRMWIGTHGGGLHLYNEKKNKFIHYGYDKNITNGISNNSIHGILEDKNGELLISTYGGGLDILSTDLRTFRHLTHDNRKNSLSNNSTGAIHEDKLGNLWISTIYGLNHLDRKTNQFTTYSTANGLPNNVIFGILQDDAGILWISSNKGISKMDPKTKEIKNYIVADGLQSYEFKDLAFCKSRTGMMYFGGINGFNTFFPDRVRDVNYEPPLVFTAFNMFNGPVKVATNEDDPSPLKVDISEAREIRLPYSHDAILFEFASLNFTTYEKKKYSYKLEGFDANWNNVDTRRSATYTNLDPGAYTLYVKGLNNNGEWSAQTISLNIYIKPPFYMTWWFRISISVLLIAAIVMTFRFRVKVVESQKKKLEEQVAERTELLEKASQDEKKARQEAEHANKAKSIFLATMSHEIRTPMNGVIGMASLLAETQLNEQQREFTETIRTCGDSLLTVINDILDFSKIESGKMELEHQDFDLRNCLEDVLDVFAGKAAQTGLDLVYEIDNNVPAQIIGDPLRLRQILINLVSNAVKFTSQGEIFLGVHLLKKQQNGRIELGFEIRDTGIGIPADKIGRLFKSFSQVDSSTTRKYGGTGLGLAITEKLVALMGGKVTVESRVGHGSTFSFTIQTEASILPARINIVSNLVGLEDRRILVVDDNYTNRNILKNQLDLWKLQGVMASSGEEALAILQENHAIDLVITDMQMPEMDGLTLATEIQKRYPQLPLILLSSVGDECHKKYPGLFRSILTKPTKQNTLCKNIIAALRTHAETEIKPEKIKEKLPAEFAKEHPFKILVAEDNLINQKLITHILEKLGYQPEIRDNGLEAVNAFSEQLFDLILMDVQMPEMDGLEATRAIRSKDISQPFIIALTANAMQGDMETCLTAGMNDYLSKPLKLEELTAMLEKWHAKPRLTAPTFTTL